LDACNISAAVLRGLRRDRPRRAAPQLRGAVYATSLICRAATPETRTHVPYNIIPVDTAEDFRMMAHGDNDLAIGDRAAPRCGSSHSPDGWCHVLKGGMSKSRCEPTGRLNAPDGTLREVIRNAQLMGLPRRIRFSQ